MLTHSSRGWHQVKAEQQQTIALPENVSRSSMSVAELPITAGTHVPVPVAAAAPAPVVAFVAALLSSPFTPHTHPPASSLSPLCPSVVQSKTCHFLRAAAVYFKIGRALCRLVLASLMLGLLSASLEQLSLLLFSFLLLLLLSPLCPLAGRKVFAAGSPPAAPFGLNTCRYFLAILIFKKQKLKTFVADFFCNFPRAAREGTERGRGRGRERGRWQRLRHVRNKFHT